MKKIIPWKDGMAAVMEECVQKFRLVAKLRAQYSTRA